MKEDKLEEVLKRVDEKLKSLKEEETVNKKGIFRDGKTFSNQENVSTEPNARLIEVSSSLVIPKIYSEVLKKKLKKYKGFKLYLHYLLRKYDIHIVNGLIPNYSNVTTNIRIRIWNCSRSGFARGDQIGENFSFLGVVMVFLCPPFSYTY